MPRGGEEEWGVVRPGQGKGGAWVGVPAVMVMVGTARRGALVGVANGEERREEDDEEGEVAKWWGWGWGGVDSAPLMGDTLGEVGGVGVTVCRCFSATESSVCMRRESRAGTCCFMSVLSSSRRWEVRRSEVGQASSSDMVMTKDRPRAEVSALWSSCVGGQRSAT